MGTETCLRLPGSNPALSVIAEQWERLALDVVSEAGSIRDVTVCQHPIFNFLRTIRRLLAENPKDQISLFFQWFPPVRCRFAAAPSQRWAGYMGGVPDCQRSKVTKATFFASGPSAAPAPVVESLIARAFRESHLVFGHCRFNRRVTVKLGRHPAFGCRNGDWDRPAPLYVMPTPASFGPQAPLSPSGRETSQNPGGQVSPHCQPTSLAYARSLYGRLTFAVDLQGRAGFRFDRRSGAGGGAINSRR